MGHRHAVEGASCHFGSGAGVVEGEANEAFDGCDGVFVVGEGGGGGGFSHGAAGIVAHQRARGAEVRRWIRGAEVRRWIGP